MAAGLAIGVVAAVRPGLGGVVTALGLIGVSIPVFWLGEVVNLLAQSRLHGWLPWLPPLGIRATTVGEWLGSLILPWLTLALLYAGVYGRVLRTSLMDAYAQDYIRTARAKGLSEPRILLRHALRNALMPALALFGLDLGALVGGGTVLTELVFGLRGVGRLIYDALTSLDLSMVMATVLYGALFVVLLSAAADAAMAWLDPRVRD